MPLVCLAMLSSWRSFLCHTANVSPYTVSPMMYSLYSWLELLPYQLAFPLIPPSLDYSFSSCIHPALLPCLGSAACACRLFPHRDDAFTLFHARSLEYPLQSILAQVISLFPFIVFYFVLFRGFVQFLTFLYPVVHPHCRPAILELYPKSVSRVPDLCTYAI